MESLLQGKPETEERSCGHRKNSDPSCTRKQDATDRKETWVFTINTMTTPEEMTPEELRVKVAGLCGWTETAGCPTGRTYAGKNRQGLVNLIPDYVHDLNACHSFEMSMGEEHEQYILELKRICRSAWFKNPKRLHPYTESATATQRCIAFIRTMEGTK